MAWSTVTLVKTLRINVVFRIKIVELIPSSLYGVKRFDRKYSISLFSLHKNKTHTQSPNLFYVLFFF